MKYKQCKLLKIEGSSNVTSTFWLPERFAIRGKVLKLNENGTGWVVIEIPPLSIKEDDRVDGYYRDFSDE